MDIDDNVTYKYSCLLAYFSEMLVRTLSDMGYFFLLNLFHHPRSATEDCNGATSAGSDSLSANEVHVQ